MSHQRAVGGLAASLRMLSRPCTSKLAGELSLVRPSWSPTATATATTAPVSFLQVRHSSHAPMDTSPRAAARKPVTITSLRNMYKKGEPIAMLTAHDFPSAYAAEVAGMDVVLVGDSLAMVALGMTDTSAVTLDDMILHCRSVSRAAKAAFVVCQPQVLLLRYT